MLIINTEHKLKSELMSVLLTILRNSAYDIVPCSGCGLFVGVELVKDRRKLTPATAEAQEVIYK